MLMLEEHFENRAALGCEAHSRFVELPQLRLCACDHLQHGLMLGAAIFPDASCARRFQTEILALPAPLLEQRVQRMAPAHHHYGRSMALAARSCCIDWARENASCISCRRN